MAPESSRIIVKNLPKWVTEEQIRNHFSRKGRITDVKLMYTRNGIFRRFAFIGLASVDDAGRVVKYFNRTFMDTLRIEVDFAVSRTDDNLQRPWSKYSAGSSANTEYLKNKMDKKENLSKITTGKSLEKSQAEKDLERKRKILESIYGEGEEDIKELNKFIDAAKPASKTKTWDNDGLDNGAGGDGHLSPAKKPKISLRKVKNKRPGGEGQVLSSLHLKFDSDGDDVYSKKNSLESNIAFESEDDDSSSDYDNNMAENNDNSQIVAEDAFPDSIQQNLTPSSHASDVNNKTIPLDAQDQVYAASPGPDSILENGRLFVRNISYSCSEEDLRELFEAFGKLSEIHLSISKETKKPKGFAYVLFMFPEDALRAYSELDGITFQGRLLHILPALDPLEKKPSENDNKSEFQSSKEEKLKSLASNEYNWNSLFIRSDTVLDAIAAKLGVTKSSIMDIGSSGNLATRLAVAETNLVHETKAYLESEGVVLDAFKQGAERSKTIILVKNLGFETDILDIRKLFEKFGALGRVLLPPTRAVAMVEFFEPSEAKVVFKALAYSKFKNAPLFLEWAPIGSLKEASNKELTTLQPIKIKDNQSNVNSSSTVATSSTTLYVKNLNFITTEDTLKVTFASIGPIRSVKIATKKSSSGSGSLSLGFGFVEFESKAAVNRAIDELQGFNVDGHALVLKPSTSINKKADSSSKDTKQRKRISEIIETDKDNTKIIVRNIPFEATEKDIRDLFKSFAQLKRVRLPKRFDGRHRGFGFIDFLTHQEALSAMETLAHTHLYGRHLVLEWSKPETTSLDELRNKSLQDMNVTANDEPRSSKVNLGLKQDYQELIEEGEDDESDE